MSKVTTEKACRECCEKGVAEALDEAARFVTDVARQIALQQQLTTDVEFIPVDPDEEVALGLAPTPGGILSPLVRGSALRLIPTVIRIPPWFFPSLFGAAAVDQAAGRLDVKSAPEIEVEPLPSEVLLQVARHIRARGVGKRCRDCCRKKTLTQDNQRETVPCETKRTRQL